MDEWQPIETAPHGRVLGLTSQGDVGTAVWRNSINPDGGYWDMDGMSLLYDSVTHWMPLPKAPGR